MLPGSPMVVDLERNDIGGGSKQSISGNFNSTLPDDINSIDSLKIGKQSILESPVGEVVSFNEVDIASLSSMFGYQVADGDRLSEGIPVGTPFNMIFNNKQTQEYLCGVAQKMFPNINPNTGSDDIDPDRFYTPYIPLVALTGCLPPQNTGDKAYFNPEGSVTVAEFLDSINSIKYGCNSNIRRKKTLDNISTEADYFNEGYQSCIRGISSPFFNLYERKELLEPITRLELAYILVICWEPFIEKYNNLYGGSYYLGISFDWEYPSEVLSSFRDGYNYKVSKYVVDENYDVVSLNIKDYKAGKTMSEFKKAIKNGDCAIPMPVFMSLLELDLLNLFVYEGNNLSPCREVSRGELSYLLSSLAENFPSVYKRH